MVVVNEIVVIFSYRFSNVNQENTADNVLPLIQRRRHKNNSLNLDTSLLVVPRPRPFSDISNDSNQDSINSPPLTPPLVGAKPPVSKMVCHTLSINHLPQASLFNKPPFKKKAPPPNLLNTPYTHEARLFMGFIKSNLFWLK